MQTFFHVPMATSLKKNRDCVEVMGEHAHTQVKMCGYTPFPPLCFLST